MATVYLADNLKHERKVALKVLKLEGEGSMIFRRTVCGEAVERSAGRRRTVDPFPLHTRGPYS